MKALICGVAGQDGSYLAELHLQKGYEVIGTSCDALVIPSFNLERLRIRRHVQITSMATLPSSLRVSDEVHVSERREAFQAFWNATRFAPSECSLLHFHGLRLMRGDRVLLAGHYRIPRSTSRIVYRHYLQDLVDVLALLRHAGFEPRSQVAGAVWMARLRMIAVRVRHRFREWMRPDFSRLRVAGVQHE